MNCQPFLRRCQIDIPTVHHFLSVFSVFAFFGGHFRVRSKPTGIIKNNKKKAKKKKSTSKLGSVESAFISMPLNAQRGE